MNDNVKIENKFYKAEFLPDGQVVVDAKLPLIKPKESSGKELPRYKVIVEYESEFKKRFDSSLNSLEKGLGKEIEKMFV